MRVLQIVNRPQRRGAETFALDLSRQLDRRGHATRIVHLYAHDSGAVPLEVRPEDRELGGRPGHPAERLPGWHPGLLRRLVAEIDAFAPDVVQVNGSRTVKYGSLARRLRREAKWALVYRSIGTPSDWLRGRLHRSLYQRLVIALIDGAVAVSEATRASLEHEYGLEVPLAVIPRGVDLHRFVARVPRREIRRELGAPEACPAMIFVGSLTPEKRPDRLLRIAAGGVSAWRPGLLEPAAELWIVGDGPLRSEVESAARQAPPGLRVRFLGTRHDVASLMAAADFLVLTSDSEGSPGVVLEAGAMSLPCAALQVGGVGELVLDGVTGLLARAGDEAALAERVGALLGDPERRIRLGAAARRRVEESYSMEQVAERVLEHYRRVLLRRQGAS